MNSQWHTWADFFAMGGYGLYVWGSMSVVLAGVAGELLSLVWRQRAIVESIGLESASVNPLKADR